MNVSIYEVGPRDGLQSLEHVVPVGQRRLLIQMLYGAGLDDIEEVSFAHPKVLPQMADAEKVFTGRGSALVMNGRGMERAKASGAEAVNIVFSPCETFNMLNLKGQRSELVLRYRTFMDAPSEHVRVYLSMAFGSPYSGVPSEKTMRSCLRDAKMFGDTVVFADTVGAGTIAEVKRFAEMAEEEGLTPALHLHHKGDESRPLSLVRAGLFAGIKQFDASIGGLGGCPFAQGSGANLSTSTLVRHLHAWGFKTGVDTGLLREAEMFARSISRPADAPIFC